MSLTPAPLKINEAFVEKIIAIARAAGDAILVVYNAPETSNVQSKSDDSPLTAADLAAHHLITRELPKLLAVPIISEESTVPPLSERRDWPAYWLVDPLDGTREFIARNGQFTVNIALVVNGVPQLGVVHVPVTDETYFGVDAAIADDNQTRSAKYLAGVHVQNLHSRKLAPRFAAGESLDILMSLRHVGDEATALVAKLRDRWPGALQSLSAGRSLKFCWIAEGRADFYPRLAPTSEWDTAAAQAVLTAAGGLVVHAKGLQPLNYNSRDSLLNPFFYALGDATFDWQLLLG